MAVVSGQSDSMPTPDLRRILHLRVPLIVKLAQCKMPLEQVLHFKPGSMMHFQKPIDAPAELLVNNKSIASGQVIQSNDRYGIRLTHVGDPRERVRSLQPLTSTRHA